MRQTHHTLKMSIVLRVGGIFYAHPTRASHIAPGWKFQSPAHLYGTCRARGVRSPVAVLEQKSFFAVGRA